MTAQGINHSLRSADVLKDRDEQEYAMRVYLHVRPLDRYEVSRRSRHCIQVHPDDMNGTTRVTIDSPYEGPYDFSFDQVGHNMYLNCTAEEVANRSHILPI